MTKQHVIPNISVSWRSDYRVVKIGCGGRKITEQEKGIAAIGAIDVVRFELNRARVDSNGSPVFARGKICFSKVAMDAAVFWLELDHLVVVCNGAIEVALLKPRAATSPVVARPFWIEPDCVGIVGDGEVEFALGCPRISTSRVSTLVIWVEPERFRIVGDDAIDFVPVDTKFQGCTPIVIGISVIRIELDSFSVVGDGAFGIGLVFVPPCALNL